MRRLFILPVLIIAAVAAWLWRSDSLAIDTCLDSGGRWAASTPTCER
ncbi:hypothetical protein J2W40_002349 [Sphingobium xenophagum]|uniref:Uncharacterized protein n=1 Tax=Sphingobium xenophagum TaxID=121428 RepID=A0ABU1X1S0_SPHXE|nr:hypothetical protein [Sphingobium xenophagum]MDR7155517.1 hypothetical protein [Sphingobium xenophagum]